MKSEEWGEQFGAVNMKDGGEEKCEKNFKMWCRRFILKNNFKNKNYYFFLWMFWDWVTQILITELWVVIDL